MRKRALIIGISKYDGLAHLDFCQNDADGMFEVLKCAGFDIPNYNKLSGYVDWKLMRETTFDFFVDHSILDDDILILYYSGHSIQDDISGEVYLAPSDIDPNLPYKNGISFGDLTKIVQRSIAKKVVLILDCCYSGSAKLAKRFDITTDGEGLCILAASQPYQEATVLPDENRSVYTHYLIEGLKGKGLEVFDHSGNITVDTLSSYVYKKMASLSPEKHPKQRPLRKIETSEDIVLVSSNYFSKLRKLSSLEPKQDYRILSAVPSEEVLRKFSVGVTLTKVEKTFRSDFIAVLRKVLEPHGLDLKDDIRINIYGEPARSPDLLIIERGKYEEIDDILHIHPGGLKAIVETKHPKKFATVGFMKLIEYCKLIPPEIGFVTNFKELIEYRIDDRGKPSITSQTLGTSADNITFRKLAAFILHEIENPKPKLQEISDENLVKVLQNYLTDVQSYFAGDVSGLANTLGIFQISYDKDLFESEEPPLQDLIRKAASFVILNQIVFYTALERKTSLVEQIESLSSLNELQEKFDHISQTIDYKAVFGARVVSSLPPAALETINALIINLGTLNFYDIKREILGKIYHNLIPKSIRKRIAAYYTSNTACELLARLTIDKSTDIVLDPACGSGGFLVAAYKIKNEIGPLAKHKDLIQTLFGFDISIFASHLSVINLTLQDLRDRTEEVYVTVDDAFNQRPDKTIELLESSPSDSAIATIDGIRSRVKILPSFDVILMNPPFTRIERLEENYKNYLIGKKGIFRPVDQYFKGQSGLHCFFLVHIKEFLVDGGRFGIVLPSATFSSEYGNKLKPFILDNYRILYIFAYERQSTFSVDCDWKEILIVGIKGTKEAQTNWNAKIIVLKRELEASKIKSFANQFHMIDREVVNNSYLVRIVSKQEFQTEWNWMTFTRPLFLKELVQKIRNSKATANQQEIVQFHEGYHIDALYFFRLPNNFWEIEEDGEIFVTLSEKTTKRKLNIPKRYLIPTLGVPELHSRIRADMKYYILNIPESELEKDIPPDVKKYIKWGETFKRSNDSNDISGFYKISKYTKSGNRWYTYGNHILYRKNPNGDGKILIGGRIAIVEKFRTKTRECITLYSDKQLTGSASYLFGVFHHSSDLVPVYGKRSDQEVLKFEMILAAWFSSTIFLAVYMYYRREISGDYGRIRINDMATLPCIDPLHISERNKQQILTEFKMIMKEDLPTIYNQVKNRKLRKLDESILRAIGTEDLNKLLDNLYTDLQNEMDNSEIQEQEIIN